LPLEVGTDDLYLNVCNYQSTLRKSQKSKDIVDPTAETSTYSDHSAAFTQEVKWTAIISLDAVTDGQMSEREERILTRCKNIDDLLSIPDVDY